MNVPEKCTDCWQGKQIVLMGKVCGGTVRGKPGACCVYVMKGRPLYRACLKTSEGG